jgi:hypothetical protein
MTEKRLKRPTDPIQRGKLIGDILTGQVEDKALTPEQRGKSAAAVARGEKGGMTGGRNRAAKLTPEQRKEIAKIAARPVGKKRPNQHRSIGQTLPSRC